MELCSVAIVAEGITVWHFVHFVRVLRHEVGNHPDHQVGRRCSQDRPRRKIGTISPRAMEKVSRRDCQCSRGWDVDPTSRTMNYKATVMISPRTMEVAGLQVRCTGGLVSFSVAFVRSSEM